MTDNRALAEFAAAWGVQDPFAGMGIAARDLLAQTGQLHPPIQLAPLVRLLGAHTRYDLEAGDGALADTDRGFVIRVRRHALRFRRRVGGEPLPPTWRRSRFTIAHELAHLLVLRSVAPASRAALADPHAHEELERLCNVGAAQLLMPQPGFTNAARQLGFTPRGLRWLYDAYLVSWSALMVQLAESFGASVTLWEPGRRRGDGELMRVSDSFGARRAGLYLPPGISERQLSQPVVRVALRDGIASCRRVAVPRRFASESLHALASVVPLAPPDQRALPMWDGLHVLDDPVRGEPVALMSLRGDAERTWRALSRSRPLDRGAGAVAPAPLAIRLAAA